MANDSCGDDRVGTKGVPTLLDWSPVGPVTLNPERDCIIKSHLAGNNIQPLAA